MVLSSPSSFGNRFHWHPAAQPEDDAVEHLSWGRALAAPGFGRVFEVDPKFGQVAKRESRSKIGRKQGAGHEANT